MIIATRMLISIITMSMTLTFMTLTTIINTINTTTPRKIMMKDGTTIITRRKPTLQDTRLRTKIRVMNLMLIITPEKAYCVKKTLKCPSSEMTSSNDMRTRQ